VPAAGEVVVGEGAERAVVRVAGDANVRADAELTGAVGEGGAVVVGLVDVGEAGDLAPPVEDRLEEGEPRPLGQVGAARPGAVEAVELGDEDAGAGPLAAA